METISFTVPGMTCGHCVNAVETEVGKVPGVESVSVDLDSKLVTVGGTNVDRAMVRTAIDEAGFDVD